MGGRNDFVELINNSLGRVFRSRFDSVDIIKIIESNRFFYIHTIFKKELIIHKLDESSHSITIPDIRLEEYVIKSGNGYAKQNISLIWKLINHNNLEKSKKYEFFFDLVKEAKSKIEEKGILNLNYLDIGNMAKINVSYDHICRKLDGYGSSGYYKQ